MNINAQKSQLDLAIKRHGFNLDVLLYFCNCDIELSPTLHVKALGQVDLKKFLWSCEQYREFLKKDYFRSCHRRSIARFFSINILYTVWMKR